METIIIIILAFALAIFAALYFRLRSDKKNEWQSHNEKLSSQLDQLSDDYEKLLSDKNEQGNLLDAYKKANDQLSKNYKELESKYNRYHRKRGADGRFVKKGGKV